MRACTVLSRRYHPCLRRPVHHVGVLDASYLYSGVNVVEECVFDRSLTSRRVNLFDTDLKYANVISFAEALTAVQQVRHRSSAERRRTPLR